MQISVVNTASGITITYSISTLQESTLSTIEDIINSANYQQDLIDFLEDENQDSDAQGDCFKFVVIQTTAAVDEAVSGGDDGIQMLDFANYGTTEYLVLILFLLVLSIVTAIIIYVWCWCKKRKAADDKAVEFGVARPASQSTAFSQALHATNASKQRESQVAMNASLAAPQHVLYQNSADYASAGEDGIDL